MPNEKSLVLVVGAGASSEVGLPTGPQLKSRISAALDIRYEHGYQRISGDRLIDAAFGKLAERDGTRDINPYLEAGWRIRDAMPQAISIDNFIDAHRGDDKVAVCGKLSIARSILEAEKGSALYIDPTSRHSQIGFSGVEATWFNTFFQLLTESCTWEELPDRLKKVAIICFNYDRCIEHYMHCGLQNYYGASRDEATEALANLEIFHPYGIVGQLPWQVGTDKVAFGADVGPDVLVGLLDQLHTFTEGVDPEHSEIIAIRETLSGCKRIAFLGFAFQRLNLELLFPPAMRSGDSRDCDVFATAYGLSDPNVERIAQEIFARTRISTSRIHMRQTLKCSDLLHAYWRGLSLA